jgi:hypothetical protein
MVLQFFTVAAAMAIVFASVVAAAPSEAAAEAAEVAVAEFSKRVRVVYQRSHLIRN